MKVRILSRTPHVPGEPGDIVEADITDPTIAALLTSTEIELAEPLVEKAEPADATKAKK